MRADLFLSTNGYAPSRQQAKRMIDEKCVTVDGRPVGKPSEEIPDGEHTVHVRQTLPYVGRGGLKLEAALDKFGLDVTGWNVLDIGASTGGFTDCLLRRSARHVWAVDSGIGQLADSLRKDPRVTSMEHCNARYLKQSDIGVPVRLIVMDVSFISATCLIPRFPELLANDGDSICLVKPQFEVGKERIGKGGIVKDTRAHRYAVERVLNAGRLAGLCPVALIPSPIEGGDGNKEFLVHFQTAKRSLPEFRNEQIHLITG